MCGIVGILQYQPNKENYKGFIEWSLNTMQHRGPDSNGIWNDESYFTGFARLSIRDLSHNGDQPMHSQCGRYVISFNGEIYNSDFFKEKLLKEKIQFHSTSDTEVLLYSLIKWPVKELLPQVNGMFALAFYDKQEKRLILARDRVGIKPLYIGWSNDGIIYSSQYDHIINHPYCSNNSLDASIIALYLNLGYVPDKEGIIQNTMLFPHGNYAVVENNDIQFHEYYNYPTKSTKNKDIGLDEVLRQSVKQQLVSDVPLGTFMSGGVDSTLVTSYAVKEINHIESFTIGVEDKEMDESEAAQAFSTIFGTHHNCRVIKEKEILGLIEDNFKAYTEPFADYSSLPTLLLSQLAREKVTVVLSGDGGDELFWGYQRSQKILNASQPYLQNLFSRNFQFAQEKFFNSKQRTILKRHLLSRDYINYYYRSLFINGAEVWVNKLMNVEPPDPYFLQQQFAEKDDLDDPEIIMNKIRKLETDLHLQRILIKVDRASMYHSLEVRVPLLDNDVLDYSTSIHYEQCVHDKQGKYNLKQLLASKTKPELVYRPKKGFTVPLANWIRNELYNEISGTILNMTQHLEDCFNKKALEQMIITHKDNKQDNSWILWAVYSLVKWDSVHRNKYKP